MRAAILAGILALTAAAGAQTVKTAPPMTAPREPFFLRLPSDAHLGAAYVHRHNGDTFSSGATEMPAPPSGLHIGPGRAVAETDSRPGRHRPVMHYEVEGMQLFGGAVGGRFGGRGALLTLQWHDP